MNTDYLDHLPVELVSAAVHLYVEVLEEKLVPILGECQEGTKGSC